MLNINRYPPASARYRSSPRYRSSFGIFLAWLGRLIDHLVAAAIARHARHAEPAALHQFSDRELNDIGICRSEIDYGLNDAARTRARLQCHDRY
jgi:uncharacterized protein YjiS (DUF1127 family)